MATEGVGVAFGTDALAEAPTYTRLDAAPYLTDPKGLRILGWRVKRGRSYFSDRTQAGTAEVDYVDLGGVLDPTNSTGPFYPMDPNCPLSLGLYDPTRSAWSTVYTGMVQQVPQSLDLSEGFLRGQITAADLMALLSIDEVPPGIAYGAQAAGSYSAVKGANGTGDTTYAAQLVDDRIRAILADAGIPAALTSIFSGNVSLQPSVEPPGASILEMLWNAADAEFPGLANFYVTREGLLKFHGRLARFNPTDPTYGINEWHVGDTAAVAAHSSWARINGLSFDRDVNKVINASLFSPDNIADADIAGQLASDAPSILKYGNRAYSGSNLLTAGGAADGKNASEETALFGQYYVDNFHDAQNRITQLTITNPAPGAVNASAQWLFLCGVEISDVVYVTTTHPGGGGFSAEPYFVEGISYDVKPLGDPTQPDVRLVEMTLDLSPQAYFNSNPFS